MLRITKPNSKLFATVSEDAYSRVFDTLVQMRDANPGYRDDELLMAYGAALVDGLKAIRTAVEGRIEGRADE